MPKINSEVKQIIEANPIAFATINIDGTPNVIGVAFVKVVSLNQVLITDNYMGQTKNNINSNNAICLAVWDKDWNGYKLIGTAKYFTDGKWKTYVEQMPDNKGLPAKGAVLITVTNIEKLA